MEIRSWSISKSKVGLCRFQYVPSMLPGRYLRVCRPGILRSERNNESEEVGTQILRKTCIAVVILEVACIFIFPAMFRIEILTGSARYLGLNPPKKTLIEFAWPKLKTLFRVPILHIPRSSRTVSVVVRLRRSAAEQSQMHIVIGSMDSRKHFLDHTTQKADWFQAAFPLIIPIQIGFLLSEKWHRH